MKRILSLLFAIILLTSTVQVMAETNSKYFTIEKPYEATVTEVLSGQSLMVQLKENNEYAYVKMIGLNSLSYDEAYEYVTKTLKGQTIYVVPDSYIKSPIEKWNQVYVYVGNINFNDLLLKEGYAKYDAAYDSAITAAKLKSSNNEAREKLLKIHNQYPYTLTSSVNSYASETEKAITDNTNNNTTKPSYLNQQININMASASELKYYLKDITSTIANNIIKYRERYGYFNTVEQIKNVTGFTTTIFDNNKDRMVVITDITTANLDELKILAFTSDEAQKFIDYRSKNKVTSLNILYDNGIITKTKFNSIIRFISLNYQSSVYGSSNSDTNKTVLQVNINTATSDQLVKYLIGVNSDTANKIVSYRENIGFFTLISRTREVEGFTRMMYDDNKDHMVIRTNINVANKEELEMLGLTDTEIENIIAYSNRYTFKSTNELYTGGLVSKDTFDKIKSFVTITTNSWDNGYDRDYVLQVNVNTATASEMEKYLNGVSTVLAKNIENYRTADGTVYFETINDLLKVEGFTDRIFDMNRDLLCVSTNIREANYEELIILGLTYSEATRFIDYREDYYIYSKAEFLDKGFISSEKYNKLYKFFDVNYNSTIIK